MKKFQNLPPQDDTSMLKTTFSSAAIVEWEDMPSSLAESGFMSLSAGSTIKTNGESLICLSFEKIFTLYTPGSSG